VAAWTGKEAAARMRIRIETLQTELRMEGTLPWPGSYHARKRRV
jgi:hypothetical protein